jgi:hypothetical protein
MVFAIPIPILLHLGKVPMTQKLMMYGIFAFGAFTVRSPAHVVFSFGAPDGQNGTWTNLKPFAKIVTAILNRYWNFVDPFGSQWMYWYVRESSTALIASNLPCTWTLIQHIFSLQSFNQNTHTKGDKYTRRNVHQNHRPKGSGATDDSDEVNPVKWASGTGSQTDSQTHVDSEMTSVDACGGEVEVWSNVELAKAKERVSITVDETITPGGSSAGTFRV